MSDWTKVSETKPEEGQTVITWDGTYISINLFKNGKFIRSNPDLVTNWMPLPDAPITDE